MPVSTHFSINFRTFFHVMWCFFFLAIANCSPTLLEATYINVFTGNDNGGIAFTGNTLGLNKRDNQNQPGTDGSIGAFINTTGSHAGGWPPGTTLAYADNGSTAVLDLPLGSIVLHAELIWGGSYGLGSSISPNNTTSITLITPDSASHTITPKVATAQATAPTFDPSLPSGPSGGFYVRSQDVTSLLTAQETSFGTAAGTYTVQGVPGTVQPLANNLNCAGWTLAVAYHNPNMFTSNLNLYTACEYSGPTAAPAALVSGFQAPTTGSVTARLFVSALEGDAFITGDHFVVGTTVNGSGNIVGGTQLFGSNNPVNNFFACQINTILVITTDLATGKYVQSGNSLLDTRGSFGNSNSNANTATGVSGARQGYDITSINLGSLIANGQTQIYAQGTSDQDVYTITALGMQLQVKAPLIQSVKAVNSNTAHVGDTMTFTETFTNIGEITATSIVFKDILESDLAFQTGSFILNGIPNPTITNTELINGIPIPDLAVGASATVEFQAVVQPTSSLILFNAGTVDYTYSPGGHIYTSQTNTVQITLPNIPAPVAVDDFVTTNADTTLNNATSILDNDTGTGISVISNTTPSHGTIFMRPTGLFTYTPTTNFSGSDSFQYTIGDSASPQQTASATVHITVFPVAQADIASVTANTVLNQTISVLDNDAGTGLSISSWITPSDAGGTVAMNTDGTYTYTPLTDFSGVDTFSYTAVDTPLGNFTSTIVTITVLPVADNDHVTTPANQPLNGTTSTHGTGITITFPATTVQGGTVTNTTPAGAYTYTPPSGYSGPDSFVYTATDQHGSTTQATVFITVLPIAFNDTGTTFVNTVLPPGASVLANDIGSSLTILTNDLRSVNSSVNNIVMASDGTYSYTPPSNFIGIDSFTYTATDSYNATNTAQVDITVHAQAHNDTFYTPANTTLNGTSVLDNDTPDTLRISTWQNPTTKGGMVTMRTNGTFIYIPPLNFSGVDTFTYKAVNSQGFDAEATVTVYVLPVAVNDTETTPENTPLNGPSVLTNDVGSGLSVLSYTHTTSAGGTVVMDMVTGTYLYTPPTGFIGTDSFGYTIIDNSQDGLMASATVTIIVTPIPNPTKFIGYLKTCKLLNRTEYRLVAKWGPAPFAQVALYRIYNKGRVIAEIPAGQPLTFKKCLKSKNEANDYTIVTVNKFNAESAPVQIRIIHD